MKTLSLALLIGLILPSLATANPSRLDAIYFDTLDVLSGLASIQSEEAVDEVEDIYNDRSISERERNILIKALFDWSDTAEPEDIVEALSVIQFHSLPLSQHILLYLKKQQFLSRPIVVDDWLLEDKVFEMLDSDMNETDLYVLCDSLSQSPEYLDWLTEIHPSIGEACDILNEEMAIKPPTKRQLRDLVKEAPNVGELSRGQYQGKPRLYQFCRTNRAYKCQLLMMDENKRWVRNSNGTVWSLPVLGKSRRGKAFNEFGGDTPAGVYTIDGVMPEANKQQIYGKWRRLIIEFISKAAGEKNIRLTLPASNSAATWWRETVIARDMGRDLFRIHGTLRKNTEANSIYYPFYPTMGCVATRETVYDGIDYKDQRILLDQMMRTQGLRVKYANETRLKGLLYVIEIDSRSKHVTMSDLRRLNLL